MTTTVGGYAERFVGDLAFDLLHTFMDEDDKIFKLTDVDPTLMTMRIKPREQTARDGQGSWYMVDREEGKAAWAWDADDVKDEGVVSFQAGIVFNGKMKHFEIVDILFKPVL